MREIDDARKLIAEGKVKEAADALEAVAVALEPDLGWQEEKVLDLFRRTNLNPGSKPMLGARMSPFFANEGIEDRDALKDLGDLVAKGRLRQEGDGYVLTDAGYEHVR